MVKLLNIYMSKISGTFFWGGAEMAWPEAPRTSPSPGVLLVTSSQSKERLQSGPGGRPEADGQTMLDPEVLWPFWVHQKGLLNC
jgi:hypothetical protein